MTEMRHITNLQTPYDALDVALLAALGVQDSDYAIGDPIPAKSVGAHPLATLEANGIVGLYVTAAALQKPAARSLGWYVPVAQVWEHLPVFNG
jgi:hypothetical protein